MKNSNILIGNRFRIYHMSKIIVFDYLFIIQMNNKAVIDVI